MVVISRCSGSGYNSSQCNSSHCSDYGLISHCSGSGYNYSQCNSSHCSDFGCN